MVVCPKCGSQKVAQILYGYSIYETLKLSEQGKYIFGGCIQIDNTIQPDYGCLDCGYRWAKELLPATKIMKIRYKVTENGPCTVDRRQTWIYEIFPNGRCIYYLYQGQDNHYKFREEKAVSPKKVYQLATEIQKILGAPLQMFLEVSLQKKHSVVCDGCSYSLQITYADKRKEVLNGDVAGGTFDSMMEKFVHSVFKK